MNLNELPRHLSVIARAFLLPVVLLAVGALLGGWIKDILDNRPGVVRAKLVSLHRQRHSWVKMPTQDSMLVKRYGTRYVLRLALVSLHRDFNVRGCAVSVKYHEAATPREGVLYWVSRDVYDFAEGKRKTLVYPLAQNMLAMTVLERGKPFDCFATFLLEDAPEPKAAIAQRPVDFEWLELRFTDFSGHVRTDTVRDNDVDPGRVLYDPTVFRDATPEENAFASEE
jgi:hypothetical protein